jgi:aryl-alcohol dehydrogenase-like predicted oxidoreductase
MTGIAVSALGFGTGSIGGLFVRGDAGEQRRAVARAVEAGISYFDTAALYGDGASEENLGRTLRELDAWNRVTVGTKVRIPAEEMRDPVDAIARSLERSLRRLGRDSVDLLQLHNSIVASHEIGGAGRENAVDLAALRDGIAEGFARVQERGLVRFAGVTGLGDASALIDAVAAGPFATVQGYFNAINPSGGYPGASGGEQDFDGLIDKAASVGLGVIAIRVAAAGALSVQPSRHPTAGNPGRPLATGAEYGHDLERAGMLATLAVQAGLESALELGIRFALSQPEISTVLVGYSDTAQLEDALRWAQRGPLGTDLMGQIVELAR